MVAPDFTEVADPRTGSATMFVSAGTKGVLERAKGVRQAGLTTETLSHGVFHLFSLCLCGSILKFGINRLSPAFSSKE